METRIYLLKPVAEANDPQWDLASNRGEVWVRAHSPADARVVASEAEIDFLDIDAKPAHGTTTEFASAFRNIKLYEALEWHGDEYPANGPREVVAGLDSTSTR
ncbi:hypothetical protein ACKTEK_08860 [Tepidamorphus sp. 3E244]|uniref:hypothetical protein n=1 Tax=Tepidamorphus sp. 3E244 TaxID=3385498 RepID=UPI0038FCCE46